MALNKGVWSREAFREFRVFVLGPTESTQATACLSFFFNMTPLCKIVTPLCDLGSCVSLPALRLLFEFWSLLISGLQPTHVLPWYWYIPLWTVPSVSCSYIVSSSSGRLLEEVLLGNGVLFSFWNKIISACGISFPSKNFYQSPKICRSQKKSIIFRVFSFPPLFPYAKTTVLTVYGGFLVVCCRFPASSFL